MDRFALLYLYKVSTDLKSVYDLQGRRVQSSKFFAEQSGKAERKDQSSKLKPGLYIKDGKKVFMK